MKKYLLISLCVLNSSFVFSESPENILNLDVNGIEVNNSNHQLSENSQTLPSKLNSMLSTATFDSLRFLDEVNDTTAADAFPCISANGCRLYYTHANLTTGLYFSERINVNLPWTVPVNLNVTGTCFTLSRNELELYACDGNQIIHYERTNFLSPFTNPQTMTLNLAQLPGFYRSVSFDSTGSQMFVYAFYSGNVKLIELSRLNQLTYDFTREISFPTGFSSTSGRISVDGLTFYFTRTPATSLSNLARMERASLADTFNTSTIAIIPELFDSSNYSVQPSTSRNDEWLVYAKAANNIWSETNLFIASKTGVINSVSENMQFHANVYPNPATENLNFKFNGKNKVSSVLKIVGIDGKQFLAKNISDLNQFELDISTMSSGLYFYSITSGNEFYQDKFVVLK